ncbi:MAG: hypothetical protein FWC34_03840 [Bacteroidetes bacterium]|nr:hypothetical protein [Bacteroidota bacterium]MCL2303429.1 hypothetical protein [Lentimicrobiaceae bacterium]
MMKNIYGNNYAALSGRMDCGVFPTQRDALGYNMTWLSATFIENQMFK